MKICYLVQDTGIPVQGPKGGSSHIRGFTNALKELGHEVTIVSSTDGDVIIPKPSLIDGIDAVHDPDTFRSLRHLFYNTEVEKTLDTLNPELIYERFSPFAFAGGEYAKKRGIFHVLEVNAPLSEERKLYRHQTLQEAAKLLELSAFFNTNLLLPVTEELRSWLLSLGVPDERIFVQPNGVDEELFTPLGDKMEFPGKVVLGFVGGLKPWHDIEMISNVFSQMADDPKYHLLIVGDGPMRKVIADLKERFPDRITVTGAVDPKWVPYYVRSMDIALSPYPDIEFFYFSPLKLYEYMASGVPVIATNIGQQSTLISDQENGILVPPGDLAGWVRAIESLSSDETLRLRLGRRGRMEVEKKHTWEKRARQFINQICSNISLI